MNSTTYDYVPGAVRSRPGNTSHRTGADVLADVVSMAILLALAVFGVAVSFTHTMQFISEHGQTRGWVVVGTACTVVLLTLQSAIEVWRDSRAGRGRGWPLVLFIGGALVELVANASTATGGFLNEVVAAWPVPVAACAVWLWTRRLQHAAEAAERAAVAQALAELPDVDGPPLDRQRIDVDPAAELTVKDRAFALLAERATLPAAPELAEAIGTDRRYAWRLLREFEAAASAAQVPGQLELEPTAA